MRVLFYNFAKKKVLNMKRFLFFLSLAALVLAGCNGGNKEAAKSAEEQAVPAAEKAADTLAIVPAEEPVFQIETTMGNIKVKLYKETPLHRDNFVKLVSQKFYNNILFHRVIKNFMIQTGDPNTKDPALVENYGKGGPGYTIPAEIVKGFTHKKGALAAARKGDAANPAKASSGSQFYIVVDPEVCKSLDGDYTIFGETLEGLDVVDKIAATTTGHRDIPVEPIRIISITQVVEQ